MSATVEITETEGGYAAVETDTGIRADGETKATALIALAIALEQREHGAEQSSERELREMAERTRRRFESEDVTEAAVEDAIAWARSE